MNRPGLMETRAVGIMGLGLLAESLLGRRFDGNADGNRGEPWRTSADDKANVKYAADDGERWRTRGYGFENHLGERAYSFL
jgi:hypothetical protein